MPGEAEAWLQGVNNALYWPEIAGWHLLASAYSFEQTSIRSESVEQHLSLLRNDAVVGEELDEALSNLPQLMVVDGLRPMYEGPASGAVAFVRLDFANSIPETALTLCPFTACEIGLTRHPSDPLSFADERGNLAVRSVWWRDGGIFRRDNDSRCVAMDLQSWQTIGRWRL